MAFIDQEKDAQALESNVDLEDDDDLDDEDELDDDDIDDAQSALRDILGRKLVPNGEYSITLIRSRYTEIPKIQGKSYVTLTFMISKGPYKGKRFSIQQEVV